MPPNESRAKAGNQGAAKNNSVGCSARCTTDNRHRPDENQVITLAERNERVLRQAHVLAMDVDLFECTPASNLLRDLAYQAWREVYVDLDAA